MSWTALVMADGQNYLSVARRLTAGFVPSSDTSRNSFWIEERRRAATAQTKILFASILVVVVMPGHYSWNQTSVLYHHAPQVTLRISALTSFGAESDFWRKMGL